jgi:2-polyprenyl-6-methoxyphenol hydroxylase-like FAD-dependent oxidoreductase
MPVVPSLHHILVMLSDALLSYAVLCCAAGVLTAHRLERLTVSSKLLVAADGPSSMLRQQALGDGGPGFEVRGSCMIDLHWFVCGSA